MRVKIPVTEAAELLQVDPQFIRRGLQDKRFDFGYAVQGDNGGWSYLIPIPKFEQATGIRVPE